MRRGLSREKKDFRKSGFMQNGMEERVEEEGGYETYWTPGACVFSQQRDLHSCHHDGEIIELSTPRWDPAANLNGNLCWVTSFWGQETWHRNAKKVTEEQIVAD